MLEAITTVTGSLMGLSFLPQAWRIIKLKHAEEVSIITFSFILFGACVWIAYGISINDKALIIANICGVIGVISVLAATLYYRKPSNKSA